MKRALLILIAAMLILPLLGIGFFYGYENWAGSVAWQKAAAILKAAGEPLSLEALQPKAVSDAENMAAAPIFRQLFTFHSPQRAEVYDLRLPPVARNGQASAGSVLTVLARRFRADFSGDANAAAQVILDGLAPMEPMLQAVREAARRPESVWPLNYDEGNVPTPFLPPLRQTVEVLAARAMVALAENDSSTALAEFELIVRLARDANQPPLLTTCVAEQAMLGYALGIVRDGLAMGVWTDKDLARIDNTLSTLNLLNSFARSVRGERAIFLAAPELANAKAEMLFKFVDFRSPTAEWLTTAFCRAAWNLRPSGWLARDQASYASFTQDWLDVVLRKDCVRPWALKQWNARLRDMRREPAEFFRTPVTAFALATFPPVARLTAYTQTRVDFTRLACAIELHHRATGHLPQNLASLSPRWTSEVPRDSVGGSAYAYRPVDGGHYVLYGRGWNARDDGGSGGNVNSYLGPSSADDWVWQPAASAPRQALAD
jgi:hypothetical protein